MRKRAASLSRKGPPLCPPLFRVAELSPLVYHRCPAAAAVPYRSVTADASIPTSTPPLPLSAPQPSPDPRSSSSGHRAPAVPIPSPFLGQWNLRILTAGSSLKQMELSELTN